MLDKYREKGYQYLSKESAYLDVIQVADTGIQEEKDMWIPVSSTGMTTLIESRIVKEYLSKNNVGTFEFNINGKPFECEIHQ